MRVINDNTYKPRISDVVSEFFGYIIMGVLISAALTGGLALFNMLALFNIEEITLQWCFIALFLISSAAMFCICWDTSALNMKAGRQRNAVLSDRNIERVKRVYFDAHKRIPNNKESVAQQKWETDKYISQEVAAYKFHLTPVQQYTVDYKSYQGYDFLVAYQRGTEDEIRVIVTQDDVLLVHKYYKTYTDFLNKEPTYIALNDIDKLVSADVKNWRSVKLEIN